MSGWLVCDRKQQNGARSNEKDVSPVRLSIKRKIVVSVAMGVVLPFVGVRPGIAANVGFVTTNGSQFELNGNPFYYAGTNCYYLMTKAADPTSRGYVDEVLQDAHDMGLSVVRTWGFNDGSGSNALQTAPGVYNESVFQGLDYVLAKADELNMRVILPLVNNWDDYGGMNQYVAWSPTATLHDDFYTDSNTRTYFQNYITTMVDRVNTVNGRRYGDDPTVLAWELANEARSSNGPALNQWIGDMSAYVDTAGVSQMVTTGMEGWSGAAGNDFVANHSWTSVDFATVHSWADHWGMNQTQAMDLFDQQLEDATDTLGKPLVLEEFGRLRDGGGGTTGRDTWFADYYAHLASGAGDGSNFWILYHDAYPDYDGYGVYYPADASTIAVIEAEADRMNLLAAPEPASMTILGALAAGFGMAGKACRRLRRKDNGSC